MRVPFIKMHGLGNDFIVLDSRQETIPPVSARVAAALADRRTGIGCDQLVLIEPSTVADFRMRIFNPDGSEVGACGNASRAVALLQGQPCTIETGGGVIEAQPSDAGISVNMGVPHFGWDEQPLAYAMDTLSMPVGWEELENPVAVNVGNPHAVFFVPDTDAIELERLGPIIENDPLFPERVNVNVATITGPASMRLRVWERGAGLTLACGTGACASAIAAMRRGLTGRSVEVTLPGGPLLIDWREDNMIIMTGPATESFRGDFAWEYYAGNISA